MQCKFTKSNNKQCQARALKNQRYCFFHDPKKKKIRERASSIGGKNSKKSILNLPAKEIKGISDVIEIAGETVNLLRKGQIHANLGNSIFKGCKLLVTSFETKEEQELIERMEMLENSIQRGFFIENEEQYKSQNQSN